MQEVLTSQFWLGLGAIIWVNIILSGDNAVVIALAARSLPAHQQRQAVIWGAAAAVVLRIVLTIVAGDMLVADPVVIEWFRVNAHWMIDVELFSVFGRKFELSAAGLAGAVLVVAVGKWLGSRQASDAGGS